MKKLHQKNNRDNRLFNTFELDNQIKQIEFNREPWMKKYKEFIEKYPNINDPINRINHLYPLTKEDCI